MAFIFGHIKYYSYLYIIEVRQGHQRRTCLLKKKLLTSDILSWLLFGHLINYVYLSVGALELLYFLKKGMRCAGVCTCAS